MKKIFALAAVAVLATLTACQKVEETPTGENVAEIVVTDVATGEVVEVNDTSNEQLPTN